MKRRQFLLCGSFHLKISKYHLRSLYRFFVIKWRQILCGSFHLKISKYHLRWVSMPSYQRGGRDTEWGSDCTWSTRKEQALMWSDLPAAGSPNDRSITFLSLEAQVYTTVLLCYFYSNMVGETGLPVFWTGTISVLMWLLWSSSERVAHYHTTGARILQSDQPHKSPLCSLLSLSYAYQYRKTF